MKNLLFTIVIILTIVSHLKAQWEIDTIIDVMEDDTTYFLRSGKVESFYALQYPYNNLSAEILVFKSQRTAGYYARLKLSSSAVDDTRKRFTGEMKLRVRFGNDKPVECFFKHNKGDRYLDIQNDCGIPGSFYDYDRIIFEIPWETGDNTHFIFKRNDYIEKFKALKGVQ